MKDIRPYLEHRLQELDGIIQVADDDIARIIRSGGSQTMLDHTRYFRHKFAAKHEAYQEVLFEVNRLAQELQ